MFHVLVKWHGSSDVRVERTKWRASPGAVCDSCGSGLERVIKKGAGCPGRHVSCLPFCGHNFSCWTLEGHHTHGPSLVENALGTPLVAADGCSCYSCTLLPGSVV